MRYMADQLKWTDQQKEHYADELAAAFHDASDYGAASKDSETKAV
ncbi:aerobic glycerol-3-phosphate dehydrogenase [Sporolactobacillus inulinus]|uniref:Aerobic glycerol-3-phosphate dehydrogenase n=1 Tax=Sporolactobacillus inulinus TaxID=2078 RepID=A0A4Y1ZE28_9BACL|nr:aerobic glycerol-3-phosphate dehydrogenase [Sporolactobacillus inulinus]